MVLVKAKFFMLVTIYIVFKLIGYLGTLNTEQIKKHERNARESYLPEMFWL